MLARPIATSGVARSHGSCQRAHQLTVKWVARDRTRTQTLVEHGTLPKQSANCSHTGHVHAGEDPRPHSASPCLSPHRPVRSLSGPTRNPKQRRAWLNVQMRISHTRDFSHCPSRTVNSHAASSPFAQHSLQPTRANCCRTTSVDLLAWHYHSHSLLPRDDRES